MRTTLSSAAIAIITGASHPDLASADKKEDRVVANAVKSLTRDVNKSYQSSKLQRPRSLLGGEECNSFNDHGPNASENSAYGYVDIDVDVGILGCRADDEICLRDETSALGGRCTLASAASSLYSSGEQEEEEQERPQKPIMAAFPNRRNRRLPSNRRLQPAIGGAEEEEEEEVDGPFVCPTNCPKDFCDCAQDDGDASACAAELNAVCTAGLIAECVPDKYLDFYTQTYCPYAKCVAVYNKPLEECSCDYYRDYCQVYYEFVESMDKCEVGECCAVQPAGSKWTCIPEMQPTLNPTGSPTSSAKPSASPTVSTKPTVSFPPTQSFAPTPEPTISFSPTLTSEPTASPSGHPTESPTESAIPTTAPTTVPPTFAPTGEPTGGPTALPSHDPSASPSSSPTVSSAPTTSHKPTVSPTFSSAPTISSAPSASPTQSAAPSYSPSFSPTQSFSPTASPSTPPPTRGPSDSPTTRPMTDTPTLAPMTDYPTATPTVMELIDKSENCQAWAAAGECEANPNYMSRECALSCSNVSGGGGEFVIRDPNGGIATLPSSVAVMASLIAGIGGALWLFA